MKSGGATDHVGAPEADSLVPPRVRSRRLGVLAAAFVRSYSTIALLVVVIVVFSLATPTFLTVGNIQSVLIVQTVSALLTFAVMLPLVVGEFDLSVGYMIGLLAMLGAFLGGAGVGTVGVILAMLAGGGLIGLLNGVLVVRARISSFIATLGVGIVLSGVTEGISDGKVLFQGIPRFVETVGAGYAGPLSISVWLTLGLAVVLFYVLEFTPLGRKWYAIGGSERVAFLAGVRTGWLKALAFVGAGVLVGVAAVVALGQSGSGDPSFGPELLLPAYAAAFLGVTTFRAGYYNIVGSVVGILLLGIGFNGLSLLGVPFWGQPIFDGGVLLLAVMAARAEARRVRVG